jgi:hypothetical protein
MSTVQIDSRIAQDFFGNAIRLAKIYCPGWNLPDDWPVTGEVPLPSAAQIGSDPGLILLKMFSHLAAYLADIENALPMHWQLAFYQFLCASPCSALPAFAPLTFALADGQLPQIVPSGTAVLDSATQSLRFKTYDDLCVVSATLSAALWLSPRFDSYIDCMAAWSGGDDPPVLFGNGREGYEMPLTHWMMIGDPALFKYDPAIARIQITLTGSHLSGEYFERWCDGAMTPLDTSAPIESRDGRSLSVDITPLPKGKAAAAMLVGDLNAEILKDAGYTPERLEIANAVGTDVPGYWLLVRPAPQVRLGSEIDVLPKIQTVACTVHGNGALSERAAANNALLDLANGGYPFGKSPATDDAFYVQSDSVFAYEGGTINLRFEIADPPTAATAEVDWQFWDEATRAWVSMIHGDGAGSYQLEDTTNGLTQSGKVSFICPKVGKQTIAGAEGYWIRAVLLAYDGASGYSFQPLVPAIEGIPEKDLPDAYKQPVIDYLLQHTKATFLSRYQSSSRGKGPFVVSLRIDYVYTARPNWMRRHNAFQLDVLDPLQGKPYPYLPLPDTQSMMYLAFRCGDAANQWVSRQITIYFQIDNEHAQQGPALSWEWLDSAAQEWRPLAVEDRTAKLGRSATIRFTAPDDMMQAMCFSQSACWLRVSGAHGSAVVLAGIYLNTGGSLNLTTYSDVILGSSNGLPNQTFLLPYAGVHELQLGETIGARNVGAQADIVLVVKEPAALTGKLQPQVANLPTSEPWVRVESFVGAKPTSRCYTLEGRSGTITFGDGVHGAIPPAGVHNIVVQSYSTTAGAAANVSVGSLGVFSAGIPGIVKVSNPVAARGGVDGESLTDLAQSGAARTRANVRTVTLEDVKALAEQATARVCAAVTIERFESDKAVPRRHIEIFVLAKSDDADARTAPTVLDNVLAFVRAHSPIQLQSRITVTSARFRRIDVVAVLKSSKPACQWQALQAAAIDALKAFLHPVNGGPADGIWRFGAPVRRADVLAALLGISGVTAVSRLTLCGAASDVTTIREYEVPCAGSIMIELEAG